MQVSALQVERSVESACARSSSGAADDQPSGTDFQRPPPCLTKFRQSSRYCPSSVPWIAKTRKRCSLRRRSFPLERSGSNAQSTTASTNMVPSRSSRPSIGSPTQRSSERGLRIRRHCCAPRVKLIVCALPLRQRLTQDLISRARRTYGRGTLLQTRVPGVPRPVPGAVAGAVRRERQQGAH